MRQRTFAEMPPGSQTWAILAANSRLMLLWRRPVEHFEFQAYDAGAEGVLTRCRSFSTMTELVRAYWDDIFHVPEVARVFSRAAQSLPGIRAVWQRLAAERNRCQSCC